MGVEVYKGWDCCRSYPTTRTPVKIFPDEATISPGEELILEAKNVHGDCDPNCFEWKQVTGSGKLVGQYGTTNLLIGGPIEDNCAGGNVIELWCANRCIHIAYITVSNKDVTGMAYRISTFHTYRWYSDLDKVYPPLDPQPTGVHKHHLKYVISYRWNNYDCMNRYINWSWRGYFTFLWKWSGEKEQWLIYSTIGGLIGGTYNSESEIPTTRLEPYFPRIEDKRGAAKIRKGCCPAGLIVPITQGKAGGMPF